jgi:phage-related tail protein
MLSSHPEHAALRQITDLESALAEVEAQLGALGLALQAQDAQATESAATALHRALSAAVTRFAQSGQQVPPAMRRRLAMAGGQVAAQRDAVARATSLLDRAIDVLLPAPAHPAQGLYGAHGGTLRGGHGGYAEA